MRFTRYPGVYRLTLNFQKKTHFQNTFTAYVDSYYGPPDTNGRISTTGFLLKMFDTCTICWHLKRKRSVVAFSTGLEYMALLRAVKECMWLKSLAPDDFNLMYLILLFHMRIMTMLKNHEQSD